MIEKIIAVIILILILGGGFTFAAMDVGIVKAATVLLFAIATTVLLVWSIFMLCK